MPAAVTCRCCGSRQTRPIGRAARGRRFAGVMMKPERDGGWLFRCQQCDLLMRHPLLPAEEYLALYAPSAGDHWTQSALRPEQLRICEHLAQLLPSGGSVLDVGCSSGDLLDALGPDFQKFGIEPSADARQRAEALGIQVVCEAVEQLQASALRFDVITAVDVIEHVPDPLAFLRTLAKNLKPGGQIVVSTGNSQARAWRLIGAPYYYSHFFEHVSFISDRWCDYAAQQGFRVQVLQAFFQHQGSTPTGLPMRLKSLARLSARWLASLFEQTLLTRLPSAARRLGLRTMVGEPGLFADHILVSFSPTPVGGASA
jgi:SAM-dependent methyltransferase